MKALVFSTFLGSLTLTGCATETTPEPAIDRVQRGASIYNVFCADCHNTGDYGAPKLAVASDWSDRSLEWETMLKDHVNKGFVRMPAKGGHPALTDSNAAAAVDFMRWKLRGHLLNADPR